MWGTYNAIERWQLVERFIPTRVGNILGNDIRTIQELRFIPTRVGNICLPLSRGQRRARFIPTRVGNILAQPFRQGGYRGSSPRVWGTCRSTGG